MTQYNISSGKIDGLGITTSLWSVLPFLPLYLVSAIITSISLALMLGGLYATLVWYVDAVERPKIRRVLTKFLVGTTHFLAHVTAMFTLSLLVVSLNNQMARPIEKHLDALYKGRGEQAPIVRDVIQEGLEPLQRKQATQQRERTGAPTDAGRRTRAAHARARARRLHQLPDPDDHARRPGRRLAVGLLLGADGRVRAHALGGGVRRPAAQELQELPAHEVREGQAHHLSARRSTRCRGPTTG